MNAKQVWQAALGQLQLQLPKADFDTWLKDTAVASYEDGTFIVGTPTPFAREWLDNRLKAIICRTLTSIVGFTVEVRFVTQVMANVLSEETSPLFNAKPPLSPASSKGNDAAGPRFVSPPPDHTTGLLPKYTFDNYIVGKANQLAHAAALAVAEGKAPSYNPLFLYGGVGLGKTHLLNAIGHKAKERGALVLYVVSETFTIELINAIREQRTEEFRTRYRGLDYLLIDDIQFIAGKESTQEEFFHTFNTLHAASRYIVVSSDRPPNALLPMQDRLRSRLEWGLIADLQPPDLEMRMAILGAKADSQGIAVPHAVLEGIARRVPNNIRQLEGALNRVLAWSRLKGLPLTDEVVAAALNDVLGQHRQLTLQEISGAVSLYYGLSPEALQGKQRDKRVALARQMAMYLMKEEAGASLTKIGRELGGRDHSTVDHGYAKIAAQLEADAQLRQDLQAIQERLHAEAGNQGRVMRYEG
ncbi:MAG: chromosomal replication initiator protein DnaA [Chloroflexi bacterium]|nr:chromosomal replication initiator protein DnaA [Chloroflexota bacterium]